MKGLKASHDKGKTCTISYNNIIESTKQAPYKEIAQSLRTNTINSLVTLLNDVW